LFIGLLTRMGSERFVGFLQRNDLDQELRWRLFLLHRRRRRAGAAAVLHPFDLEGPARPAGLAARGGDLLAAVSDRCLRSLFLRAALA
jgi:hypothetical protein